MNSRVISRGLVASVAVAVSSLSVAAADCTNFTSTNGTSCVQNNLAVSVESNTFVLVLLAVIYIILFISGLVYAKKMPIVAVMGAAVGFFFGLYLAFTFGVLIGIVMILSALILAVIGLAGAMG